MTLIRKMLVGAALLAQPIVFFPTPALAQNPDAVYDCWVGCVASRPGYEDWCTAECVRRYGNETTGGGPAERTPLPGPGRTCYGSFGNGFCDYDVKPQ